MAASRTLSNLKSILQVQLERLARSFVKPMAAAATTTTAPTATTATTATATATATTATTSITTATAPTPAATVALVPSPPKTESNNTRLVQTPVDTSSWKNLDSRSLGLSFYKISDSSRIVLKILQNEGFDAYLVGGCVRDLLLNKVPKDFDVITSANLAQIKNKFHRAYIVGKKFPICRVHVRGSAIEVSSFDTVATHSSNKQEVQLTDMPQGYDEKEFLRWRNSSQRDFTINSLFYDPFAHRVYDYSNGMRDLRAMKLRTLGPAHLSFQKDCARMLRGIRIAARLGLSFTKDTEKAMRRLHPSIISLDKGRLMMELNYMLSYGAAEPSILLLNRFKVLELLLPFHAAYLAERSNSQIPVMLMKLFFNLDCLTSCDQPCDSGLWVSLLGFHLALVNNPQDAIVVLAFSTLLYHGNWKEGVKAARELSAGHVHFIPEILKSLDDVTDEELSCRVASFASAVLKATETLTNAESLCTAMHRYPSSPSAGLVFISKNVSQDVSAVFNVLMNDIASLDEKRRYYSIDYSLLGKGDISETRFALGKIIIDTMRPGVIDSRTMLATEKGDGLRAFKSKAERVHAENLTSSISKLETPTGKDGLKQGRGELVHQKNQHKAKKQKLKKQIIDLKEEDEVMYGGGLTTLATEKGVGLRACKSKVEKAQAEDLTSSISKLETPKENDGGKRGRSELVDQKQQNKAKKQKPKKQKTDSEQKCVKEKLEEILSYQDIAQKRQQLKKVVVKDVKKLLSLQEVTVRKVKVDWEKHGEAQTSNEILGVLGKVPKLVSHNETQSPKETLSVAGKVAGIRKLRMAQEPEKISSVQGKGPELKMQQKEQLPTDMVSVLSLSNIFKRDKYATKKDGTEEKQQTVRARPREESIAVKKPRKLSSIFK